MGGAVHVLCPPLQAGKQKEVSTCVLSTLPPCPVTGQVPVATSLPFHQDESEIENLYHPLLGGHTHTHRHRHRHTDTDTDTHTHTHMLGTAKRRAKAQEKRSK